MSDYQRYQELIKPSWSPPGWFFGPVWSVLYLIIFISFGKVFLGFYKREIPFLVLLPFLLNLLFNFSFTPIQFGLKNNYLASLDVILVLITLLWAMYSIYPFYKWVFYSQIPYILWACFATILQLTINWLNR